MPGITQKLSVDFSRFRAWCPELSLVHASLSGLSVHRYTRMYPSLFPGQEVDKNHLKPIRLMGTHLLLAF